MYQTLWFTITSMWLFPWSLNNDAWPLWTHCSLIWIIDPKLFRSLTPWTFLHVLIYMPLRRRRGHTVNTLVKAFEKLEDTELEISVSVTLTLWPWGTSKMVPIYLPQECFGSSPGGICTHYLWKRNELWIQSGRTAINRTQKQEPLLIIFTDSPAGNLSIQ